MVAKSKGATAKRSEKGGTKKTQKKSKGKKSEAYKVVGPACVLAYTFIYSPDDRWDEDEPQYKGTALVPKDDDSIVWKDADKNTQHGSEAFVEYMEGLNDLHAKGKKSKNPLFKDGDEYDDEKSEFHGHWLLECRSAFQPKMVDKKRNSLEDTDTRIMAGDLAKFRITMIPYDGFGGGVTRYLDAVQLIEKRNGGSDAADDFDDEDDDEETNDEEEDDDEETNDEDF
ncbi:DUF2815 family protein [Marivibrio halodurans]|uniref:DUF2815 family protein n=1 Tax=Marivibrio halodurans TaxID=2039722 RepID=A0A8J7V133_9PROT|nr:ssDNA-binding protein [Marivibrio halodurans]MBP5855701.1 DUF2815 family protein [Marivibrio halodurans]